MNPKHRYVEFRRFIGASLPGASFYVASRWCMIVQHATVPFQPWIPLQIYEKRMPYAFAEYFGRFEKSGAVLFPPPACYKFYENKVPPVT